MKTRALRLLALLAAMALLCGSALADVYTTGNIWLRSGPGRDYDQVTDIKAGRSLEYLGETRYDERGVAWYKVDTGRVTGWVSSMYSELRGEVSVTPVPEVQPTAAPAQTGSFFLFDVTPAPAEGQALELSGYYLASLDETAGEIGLTSFREVQSEAPRQYYDSSVILAGDDDVTNIVIYGEGYSLFGVTVGMSEAMASACMNAAGLDFRSADNAIVYEHKAAPDAWYVDEAGHDSCINLWLQDGVVSEIDWSTYTG